MSDNAVLDCLLSRRSIRKFKSDPVPQDLIDKVVEAGLYAPSGKGSQSAKVIVITDKKVRDRFMVMNREIGGFPADLDPFYGAPVILAVIADKSVGTHVYDGALMIGNLLNAAHAVGLGGIWIHRCKQEFESEEGLRLLKDLGIEGEYEGIGHVALGYADMEPAAPAVRKKDRVFRV